MVTERCNVQSVGRKNRTAGVTNRMGTEIVCVSSKILDGCVFVYIDPAVPEPTRRQAEPQRKITYLNERHHLCQRH